ncbi:hypothetical protein PR048_006848 [Dryococelus australis]|uniref:Uncharacterized protein n=1 Tax=Dryococelus australis TaxID=614101 RepID=A0ABQ9IC49_9NEOP|nr:hypothetical protein PR048_006848 [Dryococelus australis]
MACLGFEPRTSRTPDPLTASRAGMQGRGETGYPRENPSTSGIARLDYHLRKILAGDSTRFAFAGGEQTNRLDTVAPKWRGGFTNSPIGYAGLRERALCLIGYCLMRKVPYWLDCWLASGLRGADWRTAFPTFCWLVMPFCWLCSSIGWEVWRQRLAESPTAYLRSWMGGGSQGEPMRVTEVSMEWRRNGGRGEREFPQKARLPAASSGTIPTCENPGVARPGIEPNSPGWEASSLTAQPPRPQSPL